MATLIHPDCFDSSISQIISPTKTSGALYLGNYIAASDSKILTKYKIGAIITVANQLSIPKYPKVNHLQINIEDSPLKDLLGQFPKCIEFIQKHIKSSNVLVHCKAGISRSASVVIAYLMHTRQCSLSKAYEKTKSKRPIINPNSGFMIQLQQFYRSQKQISEDKRESQLDFKKQNSRRGVTDGKIKRSSSILVSKNMASRTNLKLK